MLKNKINLIKVLYWILSSKKKLIEYFKLLHNYLRNGHDETIIITNSIGDFVINKSPICFIGMIID